MPKAEHMPRAMEPLSDEELQDLYNFLLAEELSEATMTLDALDGFLTALVIGPEDVPLSEWLPAVWGPEPDDVPIFNSPAIEREVVELILRHRNDIVDHFIGDAESFEPLFSFSVDDDGTEHVDGTLWSSGFITGVEMREAAWQPLLDTEQGRAWLRPLRLLASLDLSDEEIAESESDEQREAFTREVPGRVLEIFNYWKAPLDDRFQLLSAETMQRAAPKVGRNDPCPCGSGKKYKKCCGAEAQ